MLAGHVKTAEYVAERFIDVIERVGPLHVTAVTTDNAANCKAAGDIIQVGLYWRDAVTVADTFFSINWSLTSSCLCPEFLICMLKEQCA